MMLSLQPKPRLTLVAEDVATIHDAIQGVGCGDCMGEHQHCPDKVVAVKHLPEAAGVPGVVEGVGQEQPAPLEHPEVAEVGEDLQDVARELQQVVVVEQPGNDVCFIRFQAILRSRSDFTLRRPCR